MPLNRLLEPSQKTFDLLSITNLPFQDLTPPQTVNLGATGIGVWGIVREATTTGIKRYGKKKIATVCLSAVGWALDPVVPLLTNSTKVIEIATRIHSVVSFAAECVEDRGNLIFLPIDVVLFGQPIPVSDPDSFNIMTNLQIF